VCEHGRCRRSRLGPENFNQCSVLKRSQWDGDVSKGADDAQAPASESRPPHKKKGKSFKESKRVDNGRLGLLSSQGGWLWNRVVLQRRPRRVGSDENLGGRKRKSSSLGRRILRRMDEGHSAARCKLTLPMRLGRNGLPRATVACVGQSLPTLDEWVRTPSERREQAEQGWPHRIPSEFCGSLHPLPSVSSDDGDQPTPARLRGHWPAGRRHTRPVRTCLARGTLSAACQHKCYAWLALVSLLAFTIMQHV
jgi:hypothetical protein